MLMKKGVVVCGFVLVLCFSLVSAEFSFKGVGDNIELKANLKGSGSVSFDILYGGVGQFTGVGKDATSRLALPERETINFIEKDVNGADVDESFTLADSYDGSNYLLRAKVHYDPTEGNLVDIERFTEGVGWDPICLDRSLDSNMCDMKNIGLYIKNIVYRPYPSLQESVEIITDAPKILTFVEEDSTTEDVHKYFIASYNDGVVSESYLLRAKVKYVVEEGMNMVKIYRFINSDNSFDGSWEIICEDMSVDGSNTCNFGDVSLTITDVNYISAGAKLVTFEGGTGVNFNTLYDIEGNVLRLPFEEDFPRQDPSFNILNGSGTLVTKWDASWEDGKVVAERFLPSSFDIYEVVYASQFTINPVEVESFDWLAQFAKTSSGNVGSIDVLYGIVDLKKDGYIYRERFVSLTNEEGVKERFLYEDEQTNYVYSGGGSFNAEVRDLFSSGREIVQKDDRISLVEDYSQSLKALTLFNHYTKTGDVDVSLTGISLYPQFDELENLQFKDFPRPDTNYWQADLATLVETGTPVL